MTERAEFILSSTVVMLASHACTPLNPIRVVLCPTTEELFSLRKKKSVATSPISNFDLTTTVDATTDLESVFKEETVLIIASHTGPKQGVVV